FTNLLNKARATPSFPTAGSFPEVKNNSTFGSSQTNGPPVFSSFNQLGAATNFGSGPRTAAPGVPTNTIFGQPTQSTPSFGAPTFGSTGMRFGVPELGAIHQSNHLGVTKARACPATAIFRTLLRLAITETLISSQWSYLMG
uniref:Uncharacterized protein n=1 Tax=Aegilops tauschii subsp. strangulata TaxID=200361 RepID=A0A453SML4_AEGTS